MSMSLPVEPVKPQHIAFHTIVVQEVNNKAAKTANENLVNEVANKVMTSQTTPTSSPAPSTQQPVSSPIPERITQYDHRWTEIYQTLKKVNVQLDYTTPRTINHYIFPNSVEIGLINLQDEANVGIIDIPHPTNPGYGIKFTLKHPKTKENVKLTALNDDGSYPYIFFPNEPQKVKCVFGKTKSDNYCIYFNGGPYDKKFAIITFDCHVIWSSDTNIPPPPPPSNQSCCICM